MRLPDGKAWMVRSTTDIEGENPDQMDLRNTAAARVAAQRWNIPKSPFHFNWFHMEFTYMSTRRILSQPRTQRETSAVCWPL